MAVNVSKLSKAWTAWSGTAAEGVAAEQPPEGQPPEGHRPEPEVHPEVAERRRERRHEREHLTIRPGRGGGRRSGLQPVVSVPARLRRAPPAEAVSEPAPAACRK